jgi:hypothetical protein
LMLVGDLPCWGIGEFRPFDIWKTPAASHMSSAPKPYSNNPFGQASGTTGIKKLQPHCATCPVGSLKGWTCNHKPPGHRATKSVALHSTFHCIANQMLSQEDTLTGMERDLFSGGIDSGLARIGPKASMIVRAYQSLLHVAELILYLANVQNL